jgi:hypothetical protein
MNTTLRLLADLSYQYGIIGLNEYVERMETIDWLSDESEEEQNSLEVENDRNGQLAGNEQEDNLSLIVLNKWVFTIGDVDCAPSVPHGHLLKKTNKTKLNPYTGFVFDGNGKESYRLKKAEMITLWNDKDFRSHCHEQIDWYHGFAIGSGYAFPNVLKGKGMHTLPRWRKR